MNTRKPVVLLAPLDWGLGHTVRCIPIIKELLSLHCEVLVACNSQQKLVLIEDFPSITYHDLEGYNMFYGQSRRKTLLYLFLQGPKLWVRVTREKLWLNRFLLRNRVDAVISDNRYGFNNKKIPCVFITHQLRIISGIGSWLDAFIQKILYQFVNRFQVCWVPDWKNPHQNLAGRLSHPTKLPRISIKYIGGLSRFEKCVEASSSASGLLAILSGPEPQRSILESLILSQLHNYDGPAVLIRGVYNNPEILSFNEVSVINNASSAALNRLICKASLVICRAGYTSIMDILKLNKKSVLIPTPGQGEQEYLANYLHQRKLAFAMKQEDFHLSSVEANTSNLQFDNLPESMEEYREVIREFIKSLQIGMVNQHV